MAKAKRSLGKVRLIEKEPIATLIEDGPELIAEIREVRTQAKHSHCKVAALAIGRSPSGRIGMAIAANQNLHRKRNVTKYCAEQRAVNLLREQGFISVDGIFISGELQPDEQTGVQAPYLPSCGDCRGYFTKAPEVKPETLLVFVRPDMDRFGISDVRTMNKTMDQRKGQAAFTYYDDPNFEAWDLAAQEYNPFTLRLRMQQIGRAAALESVLTGYLEPQVVMSERIAA
jgi:hypothetical protein